MQPNLTFEHKILSDEFESYLKTGHASSNELEAFFDGFMLSKEFSQEGHEKEGFKLREMYRHFGSNWAQINPLKPSSSPSLSGLSPETLTASCGLFAEKHVPLGLLEEKLRNIYAGSIGYEFLHCAPEVIDFITEAIEKKNPHQKALSELSLFKLLAESNFFESFLHTRFPAQKRFSLEGLESSIVFLEEMLLHAENSSIKAAFFGMAHRGRLNLLANVFQKPLPFIFEEFSKDYQGSDFKGTGDVKYHKGAFYQKPSGLKLFLSSNPSHLEAVDPVIQGMCYAYKATTSEKTLTFMIHGDASIAGQGIVYETMQMSKIKGYDVGGVIHVVMNNQIGFTAMPEESRSTKHPTDLAKAFNCPIFHVNSEDVEALSFLAKLCFDLNQRFGIDCMIDIIGFRRWGHNESDEPSFTQPLLYQKIKDRPTCVESYKQTLLSQNPDLKTELEAIEKNVFDHLKQQFEIKNQKSTPLKPLETKSSEDVSLHELEKLKQTLFNLKKEIHVHSKLKKLFEERLLSENLDYSTCEALAFGLLLSRATSLRLSGQDSQRGTFSQRHAVLVDQSTEEKYNIFTPLLSKTVNCQILNSPLSEYADLGFEYGFSKLAPNWLTMWEAQFGDFANGAQIIIDQFIASGCTKWQDSSNLTLLMPHGYEGQGPEHSSARIERFLELAAEDNMTLVCPVKPSSYFKVLIQQAKSVKPLVVFSPKALLRMPACKSTLGDLLGPFEPFFDDGHNEASVAVMCWGKIYYDLLAAKKENNLTHISLICLEKLYPFDFDLWKTKLQQMPHLKKIVFIQDEPRNMGAYSYFKTNIPDLEVISRPPASSPATGFSSRHNQELQDIIQKFKSL